MYDLTGGWIANQATLFNTLLGSKLLKRFKGEDDKDQYFLKP
jgi:hypothetical protein